MKKIIRFAPALLVAAVALMPVGLSAQAPQGQQPSQEEMAAAQAAMMQQLPIDQQVRTGVLPNGLTYYIRHNEKPKGQADFYIAQKVGSVLENDEQRGLAHFLEHMCFNGTQNFDGNEVVNWLETKGVEFGRDLNAYTSTDETVYNIANVPTASEAVQDSCLLILHDWADGLLLLPEEIDKERGVIHQEWRSRNMGQQRLLEQLLPTMYPDSKYGYRLPIGTMEVVDNFPPQAIRDYYEAWYRPDQQGIIVVGDIDVDRIESKIKELFEPIQMPENAPERVMVEVPDTPGTIYAIGADPEMDNARISIFFKNDVMPREMRNTMPGMMQEYAVELMTEMLNQRLEALGMDPEAPYATAGNYYGNYLVANTKDALTGVAIGKGDDIRPALGALYREILRAARGGFTASEYDRARDEYMSQLEKRYNNRAQTENNAYVKPLVRHFIDNTPDMDIESEYQMMQMIAPQLPVDMVNMLMKEMIGPDNRVVLAMLPQKEGYHVPTEAELAEVMAAVDAEDIQPFVDEVKAEPLIPQLPAPGKIVSEKALPQWGATEWTLSNGAKVVLKTTDFKADEVLFAARAIGGTSVLPDSYANELIVFPQLIQQGGFGEYTNKDMQKYLQGKQTDIELDFGDYVRDINGETTPKNLPTLMELIYMAFTNVAMTEDEFKAAQNLFVSILHNQETNPQFIFNKRLRSVLYDNPRKAMITAETVQNARLPQVLDIASQMTANAADYTFYFVGAVDAATLRPLVEQYIASLPGDAKTATTAIEYDATLNISDNQNATFTADMETPQTFVAIINTETVPYSARNLALADIAGQILSQRLLAKVREDMGAVYSIWADGTVRRLPEQKNVLFQSIFPMKPEMKEETLKVIAQEFKNMESDIQAAEVAKAVDLNVKRAEENLTKNDKWRDAMEGTQVNGVDTFNGAADLYRSITVPEVQQFMQGLNANGLYRVYVLDPNPKAE